MIHPTANVYGSAIGVGTRVAAFAEIGGAVVGEKCKIQAFAFICPGTVLGDEVFVGPHCCFTNDNWPRASGEWTRRGVTVQRGASIGAGAILLPGISIGEGAMIAAGSIVDRDVPAWTLWVGARAQATMSPIR